MSSKVEKTKFEKNKELVGNVIVVVGILSLVVHLSMLIVGALYKDKCELNVREYKYDKFYFALEYSRK